MNMSKYCLGALLVAVSMNACADAQVLLGDFGHDSTATKNKPVWTIRRTSAGLLEVFWHSNGRSESVKVTSDEEKHAFWEKMWWDSDSYKGATCLSSMESIICYVPPEIRKNTDWIRNHKSDYFRFDGFAGVMEIEKIKAQ